MGMIKVHKNIQIKFVIKEFSGSGFTKSEGPSDWWQLILLWTNMGQWSVGPSLSVKHPHGVPVFLKWNPRGLFGKYVRNLEIRVHLQRRWSCDSWHWDTRGEFPAGIRCSVDLWRIPGRPGIMETELHFGYNSSGLLRYNWLKIHPNWKQRSVQLGWRISLK